MAAPGMAHGKKKVGVGFVSRGRVSLRNGIFFAVLYCTVMRCPALPCPVLSCPVAFEAWYFSVRPRCAAGQLRISCVRGA